MSKQIACDLCGKQTAATVKDRPLPLVDVKCADGKVRSVRALVSVAGYAKYGDCENLNPMDLCDQCLVNRLVASIAALLS